MGPGHWVPPLKYHIQASKAIWSFQMILHFYPAHEISLFWWKLLTWRCCSRPLEYGATPPLSPRPAIPKYYQLGLVKHYMGQKVGVIKYLLVFLCDILSPWNMGRLQRKNGIMWENSSRPFLQKKCHDWLLGCLGIFLTLSRIFSLRTSPS